MGVRPCQVKVQSASWHCIVAVKFVLSLCSVRCPICCVSACSSIRRTLQNCRIWKCGFFLSPFRETKSSGRLVQSWRSQWPSGGTRRSTSSRKRIEETSISLRMGADADQTAPAATVHSEFFSQTFVWFFKNWFLVQLHFIHFTFISFI